MANAKSKKKPTPRNAAAGNLVDASEKYVPAHLRKNGPFSDYEVRDALDTLGKAHHIKKNRKLMSHVRKEIARQDKEHRMILAKPTRGDSGEPAGNTGADDHDGDEN